MATKRIQKIPSKLRKDVESDLLAFSKLVKQRRYELKLTQEGMAELLDMSQVAIQHIEQGRRYPSLPLFFAILRILKIEQYYK